MKILKIAGIVVAAIIVIIIILGLLAPSDYVAERKIVIDAPKELVFDQVKYWRNWKSWSPWAEQDSSMQVTIKGVDGEVGAIYSWVGDPKKTGSGEMTNTGVQPGKELLYHLHFIEPYDGNADGWMRLRTVEGAKTEASWGFSGDMAFPMNIMLLFTSMESMMSDEFDRGLTLLKEVSEKQYTAASPYKVEEIEYPATTFAVIRAEIPVPGLHDFFMESYATISAAMGRAGARMAGAPCGLYYTWDEQNNMTDLGAAIPVNRAFTSDAIETVILPARTAYRVDYYGPYEGVGPAHTALSLFLAQHGLEQIPPVIEEYSTDPQKEPDQSKWLTRIYYFGE